VERHGHNRHAVAEDILLFLILFVLLILGFSVDAGATTRWVIASGGLTTGNCDTTGTACTRDRALTTAVAGDEIVFRDGTYTPWLKWTINKSGTSNAVRLTIRAENRYGAVIRPSAGEAAFALQNNNWVTVRGFKVEGLGINSSCMGTDGTGSQTGIIIEDNWCLQMGGMGMYFGHSKSITNFIIRYNRIDGTGYNLNLKTHEALYLGTNSTSAPHVDGFQIYGNLITDCSSQAMDIKDSAFNFDIHHNVIEDCIDATAEGRITNDSTAGLVAFNNVAGTGSNVFRDNIMRALTTSPAPSIAFLRRGGTARNNVIHDLKATSAALYFNFDETNMIATNNTTCSTPTTFTDTDGGALTAVVTGTVYNQAQGVCDAEVTRIIGERAARPVIATAEVGLVAADKIRITLTNESLAALDGAAMYSDADLISSVTTALFTCSATASRICVDGTPATISSAAVVGTNIVELTLAVAIEAGEVVTLNGTAGAVVNTGLIGPTWISDLASSATFTNRAVTNNVAGAAPSHVLDQKTFQFYSVRTSGGLLTKLPHAAAALDTNVRTVPGGSVILGIQIDGTVADPPPMGVLPYYQKNGAGGYATVPGSFGADNIRIGTSQTGTDVPSAGEAVATCLTGALTPVSGQQVNSANAVPTFDLTQDDCIVNRWSIEFDTDVTAEDYYEIRLYNQDTNALDTYTVTPRIDIISDRAGGGT
jgi:hypothetical protein